MEQSIVVEALASAETYPDHPESVEHLETHLSHVFLAGDHAYKLKKAIQFPFVDLRTLDRRHHFCLEEVRLNRRLCPEIYVDVVPITLHPEGGARLGGTGATLDFVVRMRRLPTQGMLEQRVREGRVDEEMIDALASKIAEFHARSNAGPRVADHASPSALSEAWEENLRQLRPFVGRILSSASDEILASFGPGFIATHERLLRSRQEQGRIREGHGDLHSGNVCIVASGDAATRGVSPLPPGPYVFDCIEFSEAFRCGDVAAEVAFLAMDLEWLARPDLAERFIDRYVRICADPEIRALFDFYACHRALVRAKVEALKSEVCGMDAEQRRASEESAREHAALAQRHAWHDRGPMVVAFTGLSGVGKSTVARRLSDATGFYVLSTDAIRKSSAAGFVSKDDLYSAEARRSVYGLLRAGVEDEVAAGRAVIADGTFIRLDERRRLAEVARRNEVPLVFLDCRASETAVRRHFQERAQTPSMSDADWETHLRQREERDPFGPDEPTIVVNMDVGAREAEGEIQRSLWRWAGAGAAT